MKDAQQWFGYPSSPVNEHDGHEQVGLSGVYGFFVHGSENSLGKGAQLFPRDC
ncbi:hypothetical protein SynA1544_01406 [Synechococcus sp. A15-44]|nr:hypothetical protein SynA1544_01406 [Synechococcus sp. A15-44]